MRPISELLPDWYLEVAKSIRDRLKDHPEITHLHGARLVSEEHAEYLEKRAGEFRRVIP